jgi:iron(III) transport system permease protein
MFSWKRLTQISSILWILLIFILFSETITLLFKPTTENWQNSIQYILGDVSRNTIIIVGFSTLFASLLGITLASSVTLFNFKGRKLFRFLFYLPLAFPPYVLAYFWTYFISYTGTLQTSLRYFNISYQSSWFVVNPIVMAIFVYSASLFPYVYISTKAIINRSLGNYIENARVLGYSYPRIFFYLILPLSLPALLGGGLLVALEVLSDYGVVSYLGIPSFSTAIVRSWLRFQDFDSALRLASLLMFATLLLLALFSYFSRRMKNLVPTKVKPLQATDLKPIHRNLLVAILSLFMLVTFGIPFVQLILWSIQSFATIRLDQFIQSLFNSLILSIGVTFSSIAITLILANHGRIQKGVISFVSSKITLLGYSIPGTVIGILCLVFFLNLRNYIPIKLNQSIYLLVFSLIIRYAGLAFQSIEQGFNKLGLRFNEAAQVLGKSYFSALIKIDLVLLKPALFSAFTMVFLDIIKELPLSLLLRPFNFNTLATQVYQYASDEMLVESAFPTLMILILSFIMITLFFNFMQKESH